MFIGPTEFGSIFFIFFRGGQRLVDLFSLQPKFDWKCNLAFLSKGQVWLIYFSITNLKDILSNFHQLQ